ncbi:HD domain-containing protein [Caldibacillus lycopersici]|uniref:HD domain-containing protein n=1 Tax=Perspicuibacillus lycopersici TaxID=1325689 RepID=A0AAE3LMQ2_9BACI|nr:HD domain-containing phosphohydrolase [Perspicuibacillus lycopersici]MCU9613002.1 HD domain-containing protein [Perspicuibacillus lycopersici]
MYKKSVKWIAVGDQLAEDIYEGDTLLLKKGTILTLHQVFTLQCSTIEKVCVHEFPSTNTRWKNDTSKYKYDSSYNFEKKLYEYVMTNLRNGRYQHFFQEEENYQLIKNNLLHIMTSSIIDNVLSALKIWDKNSFYHSIDAFIIGTLWLNKLGFDHLLEGSTGFLLHDIGKIKIPRDVLLKKEKLTEKEYEIVKMHVNFGEYLLKKFGFSGRICDMAMYHHHTLDGSGYPNTVCNHPEPTLEIKALMIVDVFSALTLDRPYRKAYSNEEAIAILKQEKHKYDPQLLESFVQFIS